MVGRSLMNLHASIGAIKEEHSSGSEEQLQYNAKYNTRRRSSVSSSLKCSSVSENDSVSLASLEETKNSVESPKKGGLSQVSSEIP